MYNSDTPLWQLTVKEFLELQEKREVTAILDSTDEKYVYGISVIQEVYGCSKSTANRIKQSGRINKAISQIGRTIVVDKELALKLFTLK